jgi:hypothetical protein
MLNSNSFHRSTKYIQSARLSVQSSELGPHAPPRPGDTLDCGGGGGGEGTNSEVGTDTLVLYVL